MEGNVARNQADRRDRPTFSELAWIAVRQTFLTMVGGTFGVMLVGGFESRADFWLFLLFCAFFAIPGPNTSGQAAGLDLLFLRTHLRLMEWFYALAASLLALATLVAALGRFMSGAADLRSLFKKI
jgi:hypothetical protein